jgi:hypothetical protein
MPKPFYSMEEVCEKLGKTQDQVKALVRDGTLREFRDAGKVFFKADDIEKMAAASAPAGDDTGEILLESVPEPAADKDLPGLADSAAGGTSIIGLEPMGEEEPEKKKEDTVITASGIGVFDDDELEIDADPMAKTQITTGATDDQVSLEGAGSGSGLLDLAREADDTALGADLLDEISTAADDEAAEAAPPVKAAKPAKPAARAAAPPPPPAEEAAEEEAVEEEPSEAGEVVLPVMTVTGDPSEGIFSGVLVGALVVLAVAASVIGGVVQGYMPDYGRYLGDGSIFWFFIGGAVVTVAIATLVGWFVGKAVPKRR